MFFNIIILSHQCFIYIDLEGTIMNILFIIMLCITPLLHCADYEFDTWGLSPKYSVEKYYQNRTQFTELPEGMVMNPFWLKMKEKPQEEKISVLINICKALPGDYNYLELRYNIAAATYAGIDLPLLQLQVKGKCCGGLLLRNTVLMQDYPLTKLLLEHKADVHETFDSLMPVINLSKTVTLTELLIGYGALDKNTKCLLYGKTLLHQAMNPTYEPALISLYKEQGIDPLTGDSSGYTPLMDMIICIYCFYYESHDPITRVSLLLEGLSTEKSLALINATNNDGETIFDIIKRKSDHSSTKRKISQFNALHNYLVNRLVSLESIQQAPVSQEVPATQENHADAGDCAICLQEMIKSYKTTACNHTFHIACLDGWLKKSRTCPNCRAAL